MAKKGARNLILLSRSGAASKETAQVVVELQEQGIHVAALAGMPPIKGCINAAMVLQDAVFDNMTHAQWHLTVRSKVQTSLNLNKALPRSLDFFVLLSSLAGIHGSIAQSNYAAGCSAQDALARHRVACGQKGVTLDIGWMRNIGIIAEVAAYQVQRRNAADMAQIDGVELMALLDLYCDPARPLPSVQRAQLLIGVVTPAHRIAQGQAAPELTRRPLFAGFAQVAGSARPQQSRGGAVEDIVADGAAMFRLADTTEAQADIVVRVLAARLARALGIEADDIDRAKQLSDYGVDSLMAVELRNWLAKDFGANVAVFDITGGASITMIGDLVVANRVSGQLVINQGIGV
ncbi:KR domain-containing protein [Ustulina deusta]|nr:KR domain-containing protein [Ustulina deusta]